MDLMSVPSVNLLAGGVGSVLPGLADPLLDPVAFQSLNEQQEHHHLVKRTYFPGADAEDTFNALVAPEGIPNFIANSFMINLIRGLSHVIQGDATCDSSTKHRV